MVIRKAFDIEKLSKVKVKETEVKPVAFTDLMQPIFSDCGQILGFELRKEFVMI